MPTQHLLIKGKVQGVYFRASAKEIADSLGLGGWIRNTPEGFVEAIVSGTSYQLRDFADWCRKGPRSAVVTAVDIEDQEEQNFRHFAILRS